MANSKSSPERIVREIKRKTRKVLNAEEKIRIILEGFRGEDSSKPIHQVEQGVSGIRNETSGG